MSSNEEVTGMAVEGYPKGPEIPDKSQVDKGQPGIQADMQTQPVTLGLPTQHGHQDVLTLEEYTGVGKLKGRVVIITGGDSGIGRSVAVMMAKEKAKAIAIVYLPKEQQDADDTAKMLEKEGTHAILLAEDLSQGEPVCKRIIDEVVGKYGKIDILVNNAAIQHIVNSITETTPEIVESTFKTNIFPMFYLCKYAVPHMPRGSSIINTTSVTAYQGAPSLLEYSTTKGAITSFTRSLSKQLAPKGIRVNGVAPGPIWTPLQPASMPDDSLEGLKSWYAPLGRIGQPAEVGPSYVFLASQEASYFTGQVLHPNGGSVVNGVDRLKLRKVVNFWPLRFTLKADYETASREFTYGASCKDALLRGRFSLNLPYQRVDYKKKLPIAPGLSIALAGSVSYANLEERKLDPCFGVQLEFGELGGSGSGRSAVWAGNAFGVRQKLRVHKGLRFEVCGSVQLPTPAARYRMDPSMLSIGDGAFHIHVDEVNAIVKI